MNKKVTIYINTNEYDAFSKYCKENGYTKSRLIERLIKEFMKDKKWLKIIIVEENQRVIKLLFSFLVPLIQVG